MSDSPVDTLLAQMRGEPDPALLQAQVERAALSATLAQLQAERAALAAEHAALAALREEVTAATHAAREATSALHAAESHARHAGEEALHTARNAQHDLAAAADHARDAVRDATSDARRELETAAEHARSELAQAAEHATHDAVSAIGQLGRNVGEEVQATLGRHATEQAEAITRTADGLLSSLRDEHEGVRHRAQNLRAAVEDIVQAIVGQVPVVGPALSGLADRIDGVS